jgi:hypothetical protein
MKLPPEWSELIDLLFSHRVRFLVVGAHALAAIGRPRATVDLDLFVEASESNARRLSAALADFGYRALADDWREFMEPDRMATLGRPPLRIDIMTSISGVSFERAWRTRLRGKWGSRSIGFLGREAFLANKRAAGRPKDLLDIELLREAEAPARARPRRKRRRPRGA